jgi:hypothetical protein
VNNEFETMWKEAVAAFSSKVWREAIGRFGGKYRRRRQGQRQKAREKES